VDESAKDVSASYACGVGIGDRGRRSQNARRRLEFEPSRTLPETREASVPSGRKHRAADIDRRFQLKRWQRTGVCPLGAQVDLTEGRRLNPLSSWKTIHASLARAFSLPWASGR